MISRRKTLGRTFGILSLLAVGMGTLQAHAVPPSCVPVETTPPKILIVSPQNQALYVLHQPVSASWVVSDPDPSSGLKLVAATVPDDGSIDTSKTGRKEFTVSAVDNCGNIASSTIHYWVIYRAQALEPLPQAAFDGGTAPSLEGHAEQVIPFSFSITDFFGTSISNAVGTLTVINTHTREILAIDPKIIGIFRYDADVKLYRYSFNTSTLSPGNYEILVQFNDGRTLYRISLTLKA